MDKGNEVYVYTGILLSHKNKEILLFVTIGMDFEGMTLSELSQEQITNTAWLHFYVDYKKAKLIETEHRMVVSLGQGWEKLRDIGQKVQISS